MSPLYRIERQGSFTGTGEQPDRCSKRAIRARALTRAHGSARVIYLIPSVSSAGLKHPFRQFVAAAITSLRPPGIRTWPRGKFDVDGHPDAVWRWNHVISASKSLKSELRGPWSYDPIGFRSVAIEAGGFASRSLKIPYQERISSAYRLCVNLVLLNQKFSKNQGVRSRRRR